MNLRFILGKVTPSYPSKLRRSSFERALVGLKLHEDWVHPRQRRSIGCLSVAGKNTTCKWRSHRHPKRNRVCLNQQPWRLLKDRVIHTYHTEARAAVTRQNIIQACSNR